MHGLFGAIALHDPRFNIEEGLPPGVHVDSAVVVQVDDVDGGAVLPVSL